ncbi:uncharacterized protein LOC131667838 [Phymastichus coffea]|uniref:uncharacterized protein LOC131667838 n=1 Tax=Phymastichus coffea TaxID=108790 RepID=UPI00273BAD5E|nr:uncharacterized protein LOC131667838 [Phymastichus coffea]
MEHQKVVEELHKPAIRNYPRRKYDIRGIDETWQADLVGMQAYSRENRGYMKKKVGSDVAAALKSVLVKCRVPNNLNMDRGKEFYNATFEALMKKYNIYLYSTYSSLKASICERLTISRTLKNATDKI